MVKSIVLLGATSFTAFGATGLSGTAKQPALRLLDRNPLTVLGAGFPAAERVRVSLVTPKHRNRTIRAGRRGGFSVAFPNTRVDRCQAVRIVALSSGGRTWLKVLPAPACLPARAP